MSPGDRWCCPCCGAINVVEGEFSAAGFCQHAECSDARYQRRLFGVPIIPEILAALGKERAAA